MTSMQEREISDNEKKISSKHDTMSNMLLTSMFRHLSGSGFEMETKACRGIEFVQVQPQQHD